MAYAPFETPSSDLYEISPMDALQLAVEQAKAEAKAEGLVPGTYGFAEAIFEAEGLFDAVNHLVVDGKALCGISKADAREIGDSVTNITRKVGNYVPALDDCDDCVVALWV